jgi:hypothetical protein
MKPLVRRWTEQDLQKLRLLMSQGASASRCAAALNRSASSVKKAARQLGGELAGVRALKAQRRDMLQREEESLRPGQRRNDGTYV